ncbi:MAG: hypothetical protein JTT11_01360 [Candidatus Brockarchaeota archaeon]|nr:hypothetical protein [Candidatus Brockarchaeota archaeon]
MHTILDSVAANSAVWILLCLVLLTAVQTERVSSELKESYFASQAADIVRTAESLGYVDELARCCEDSPSAREAMSKIAQLCPEGSAYTLVWKTEEGEVIGAIGAREIGVAGYVTVMVSTPTRVTYLTLGVGED